MVHQINCEKCGMRKAVWDDRGCADEDCQFRAMTIKRGGEQGCYSPYPWWYWVLVGAALDSMVWTAIKIFG